MVNNFQNGLPKLDELDSAIIRELQQDARANYLTLASKLGVVHSTVSRRLNRLIDQHVISFAIVTDYAALGYGTMVILAIKTSLGMTNDIARRLVTLNEIKSLWITAGRYDIVAVAFYKSFKDYLRWLREDVGDISEKITIETMLVIKEVANMPLSLPDSQVNADDSHSHIMPTELDLRVISELQKSPRATVKDIATNTGATFSSVRSAFRKLTSRGIIRVVSIPNPSAFGYIVRGITLIQARPSSLNTVIDKLRGVPSVNYVDLTFGAFNCLIWTSFQNSHQMSNFLAEDLGNMPGVAHYESLVGLRIEKSPLGFSIEDQPNNLLP